MDVHNPAGVNLATQSGKSIIPPLGKIHPAPAPSAGKATPTGARPGAQARRSFRDSRLRLPQPLELRAGATSPARRRGSPRPSALPAAVTGPRSGGGSPRPAAARAVSRARPAPAPSRCRRGGPGTGTSPMQSPMTSSFSVLSAWFRHTRNASASRCTACTAILPPPPPQRAGTSHRYPAHGRANPSRAYWPCQPIGAVVAQAGFRRDERCRATDAPCRPRNRQPPRSACSRCPRRGGPRRSGRRRGGAGRSGTTWLGAGLRCAPAIGGRQQPRGGRGVGGEGEGRPCSAHTALGCHLARGCR